MKNNKLSNKLLDWFKAFTYIFVFILMFSIFTNNIVLIIPLSVITLSACVGGFIIFWIINKIID